MLIIDIYKIINSYNAIRRRSDETRSLLGGKWRFSRMKVRLCSEETPGVQNSTKKGGFETTQRIGKNTLFLQRATGLKFLLNHPYPI
jgi:hypothetical protein